MFIKRRLHIEFLNKTTCIVTNSFRSKKIEIGLENPIIMNALSFDYVEEEYSCGDIPYPFFIIFEIESNRWDDYAIARIMAQNSYCSVSEVGTISYQDKEKVFSTSVWEES